MKSTKLPWTPKAPIPDLRRVANPAPNPKRNSALREREAALVKAQADRLLRDLLAQG